MTHPFQNPTRRAFLTHASTGIGLAALGSLMDARAAVPLAGFPHTLVKAKRVIYLFQSGAPSQMDLF